MAGKKLDLDNERYVERVRRLCLELPETWEKLSHGEPTFFVGKKVFAMCSINHHDDGHIAVNIPAAIGIQEQLVKADPKKFYRPPYVGVRGWIGIELPLVSDKELAVHLLEAWRLIATPKIQRQAEAASASKALSRNATKTYVIDPNPEKSARKK
jgi:hypothetical protein